MSQSGSTQDSTYAERQAAVGKMGGSKEGAIPDLGRRRSELRGTLSNLVLLALPALCSCGINAAEDGLTERETQEIVGGMEATEGDWPTVVSISYKPSPAAPWHCGGTLIGPTWVLTAAHCVDNDPDPADYEVIVGRHDITSNDGDVIDVSNITIHPNYATHFVSSPLDSGSVPHNDLAILELDESVGAPFSRLVSAARMSEILAGDDSTILGWGDTSQGGTPSDVLQLVTVDVIGRGSTCEAASDYDGVTDNEICLGDLAGGHDSCQGDSGGPAFVRRDGEWFLLGAVSWGFGCALADHPGVYTYLPQYLDWVRDETPGSPAPSLLPSAQIAAAVL